MSDTDSDFSSDGTDTEILGELTPISDSDLGSDPEVTQPDPNRRRRIFERRIRNAILVLLEEDEPEEYDSGESEEDELE